jgi:hypothetical protein
MILLCLLPPAATYQGDPVVSDILATVGVPLFPAVACIFAVAGLFCCFLMSLLRLCCCWRFSVIDEPDTASNSFPASFGCL